MNKSLGLEPYPVSSPKYTPTSPLSAEPFQMVLETESPDTCEVNPPEPLTKRPHGDCELLQWDHNQRGDALRPQPADDNGWWQECQSFWKQKAQKPLEWKMCLARRLRKKERRLKSQPCLMIRGSFGYVAATTKTPVVMGCCHLVIPPNQKNIDPRFQDLIFLGTPSPAQKNKTQSPLKKPVFFSPPQKRPLPNHLHYRHSSRAKGRRWC